MTLLDFYTLDLTTIVIILLITLAIFMLLNHNDKEKDKNFYFNLSVSLVSGIIISMIYSYVTIEPDELLTTNYWD